MSLSFAPLLCRASISSPMERASSPESHEPVTVTHLAVLALRAQSLAEPVLIVRDEVRGRAENMGVGAVVTFQPDHLGAREILLETQDVVDLRAAPAIDRLVVVADAAQIARALREQAQPQILRDVGVLVLVDQHVAEALVIDREHVRVLAENPDRLQQEIAEIGGVQDLQPVLIGGVKLFALTVGKQCAIARRHVLRRQAAVLPAVDGPGEAARRPALLVDIFGRQDLLDEADLVVGIEDREARLQPCEFGMAAQDLRADRMERAEPRHAFRRIADKRRDAVLHLARGLVGEGHGQDFGRPGFTGRQNMRDARGQDSRLAGARAGEDEQGAVERLHRVALFGVQAFQIIAADLRRGGECARGDAARPGSRRIVVEKRNGNRLSQNASLKAGRRKRRPSGAIRFTRTKWHLEGAIARGRTLPGGKLHVRECTLSPLELRFDRENYQRGSARRSGMSEQNLDLEDTARHCREVAKRPGSTAAHRRLFSGLARFYETLASEETKAAGQTSKPAPVMPPKPPAP